MSERTLEALRGLPRKHKDFVLVRDDNGGPHTDGSLETFFARALRKIGEPEMGLHALRHCALTRMARAGTPGHVIRQISGHSNLAILQVYLHDDVDDTAIAVERLEAMAVGEIGEKPMDGQVLAFPKRARKRS